ncbi:MAG: cytochrome d ubiquinol oxidase subunit II [Bacillota bacterium]
MNAVLHALRPDPAAVPSGPELYLATWMVVALTAYAFLGAADFGGGLWDLLATGPRAGERRRLIARAMGPVWEANHVWLIFAVVLLFSGFPTVFSTLSIALFMPLHLVLLGIVLRGAAFVFRSYGPPQSAVSRVWASVFGAASIVTPFLLGVSLGAVSSGVIRVVNGQVQANLARAMLSPFSLVVGLLTLMLGAYLAAVYLTLEGEGQVREDFRRRALAAGLAVAALAAALLPLMQSTVPWLAANLLHPRSLPLLAAGALAAAVSFWALWTQRFYLARFTAVAEVITLFWGWSLAQFPYLVYPDLTLLNAAAPPHVLEFLLRIVPWGLAVLLPSLALLFYVFKGENPAVPRG